MSEFSSNIVIKKRPLVLDHSKELVLCVNSIVTTCCNYCCGSDDRSTSSFYEAAVNKFLWGSDSVTDSADRNLQNDWWLNFSSCGFSYMAPLGATFHLELMWLVNVKEKLPLEFTLSPWLRVKTSVWFEPLSQLTQTFPKLYSLLCSLTVTAALQPCVTALPDMSKDSWSPVHLGSHGLKGSVLVEHFCSGEVIQQGGRDKCLLLIPQDALRVTGWATRPQLQYLSEQGRKK